ncbi:Rid family detoxifying hydrolase [Buchnera aphidicola]|uniref:Rid family detoxifying hydrolase n=1 Tax=Buchnera aphidicola TaxID=9 RepID=UPI003463FFC8
MKIYTKKAPKVLGPYSQGIKINNFLIISGQIPIDPITEKIPKKISDQTLLVLKNIKSIILKAKFHIKNIIKTTIFTTKLNQIHKINKMYEFFFKKNKISIFPARSCVEVSKLPLNVKIEIESISLKK